MEGILLRIWDERQVLLFQDDRRAHLDPKNQRGLGVTQNEVEQRGELKSGNGPERTEADAGRKPALMGLLVEGAYCGGPTGIHEPAPDHEGGDTAVGSDLDVCGMEMADHVGKSAVGGHVEALGMALHVRKPDAEQRVGADYPGPVFPYQEAVLRAGVGGVEPAHAASGLQPCASSEHREE